MSAKSATAAGAWSGHDTWLLVLVGLSIATVVVLIAWARLHAFLALMLGAFTVSMLSGEDVAKAADSFTAGVGATIGKVGVLIVLGAILGRLMADSGGIDQIVATLTRVAGPRRLPWAITLIACVVGLPMFFEVGFVMLVPLVLQIARRAGQPVLRAGIPAMAGLATVHALVPPHPGVLVAISAVHADIGLTLVYGLIVAVPCAVVVGPLFTAYIWPRVTARVPESALAAFTTAGTATAIPSSSPAEFAVGIADRNPAAAMATAATKTVSGRRTPIPPDHEEVPEQLQDNRRAPRFSVTIGTVLLPVALMMLKASCDTFGWAHGAALTGVEFLGTPVVALLVAVVIALFTFGWTAGASRRQVHETLSRSFPPIAGVLVIVGAGGGYSQALHDSGVNSAIGQAAQHLHVPLILLAWLTAALMRTATGSGTVATVAAAGIVGPMAHGPDTTHAALLALALGSGAAFLGHVNDASFWMFKEYFGLTVGGTLRTWTASHTLLSLTSLGAILALSALAG
ncbi:GntP family permease [Streptomyces fulvoviolaceus]|uniref:GntP family permease n=1 Tax=Streptomyces fulvoviolaceus TaxID=285535 RepID=UPI0021BF2DF1|nr:GntP family permease [Streptomyces fulvoviolaceus]MCT9078877.1 GntP family permease [Streptomyces fulvoviolaceus]